MASITSMGIGSGLDISSLVSQLVKAEGDPATTRLDSQETKASAELSALATLKSGLSLLRTSVKGLLGQTAFQGLTASSSDESIFTASASGQAPQGQYQVEVLRLAQRHKLGSDLVDSTQTFGGSAGDQLQISAGDESFAVDLSTDKTLTQIRDAINASSENPGIVASLVNVDDTHQVLTITAAGTGQANAVTVSQTLAAGPSLSLHTANLDASGQPLTDTAELDAAVRIDGVEVRRSSNQLTDVIDGLTLDLHQAKPGTPAALNVGSDLESASSAVSAFVTKFNALVDTLTSVSGYKGAGADQPALFGDAATRGIANRLRVEVGQAPSGLGGAFSALSELGIGFGTDGKLTLDTTKLDAALSKDLAGVGELFGSDDGVATRMDKLLGSYLETGGILDSRTTGVKGRLDRIEDSRVSLERRLSALETRYVQQFTAMDALVGQLQSTSSFLTQQFAALTSSSKN